MTHTPNWLANLKRYGPPPGKIAYHTAKRAHTVYKRQRGKSPYANTKRHKGSTRFSSTPRTNPVNAQAGRASKRVRGHSNVKSIVHRKRAVKVSKSLRKKVQKVINGNSFKGTYHTTRFGTIGITTGPAETFITEDQGGYQTANAYLLKKIDFTGNTRFWFSHALQSTNNAGSTAQKLEQGSEWQFFSPMKILDAASVLWNDKAISRDYKIQAGNLNTVVVEATGVPVVGTDINPAIKGLKIHIDNCYVKFKLKNNSQRLIQVNVYNVVPKIKFPTTTPLTAFEQATIQDADGANSAYISAETDGYTQLETEQALISNPAFEPNMLPGFRQQYKYEKVVIRIAPGETCTHSVQGPKGYDLDYRKLFAGGENAQALAYKGTTMFTMMSLEPDLVYATGGVGDVAATDGRTGHFGTGATSSNTLSDPISIEWEEVYRLSMPDIVGFKTSDGIGGSMQLLNKRIPRRAFGNFTKIMPTGEPVYTTFDEENPAIDIDQGQFN